MSTFVLKQHDVGFLIWDLICQKGVFFDGHEREDVVYRSDFLEKLAKLDETTITPAQQSPCVADGEQLYIRVVHSNADQTRFWNDGEAQVLRQKSLGSSIMVSDFLFEGNGYLNRLYAIDALRRAQYMHPNGDRRLKASI